MSERSGLGLTELAVLEALDQLTSGRPKAFPSCAKVLGEVDRRIGLGPRYGYDLLLDLARPWTVPVRLVGFRGNYGQPGDDFPAAGPGYTMCRPSRTGEVVLAAERHQLAPVPIGLINGTHYRSTSRPPWDSREATQPPLEPLRALAALRRLVQDPGLSDPEIAGLVGPPDFLTGCDVSGDLSALADGRPTPLRLTGRITAADEQHLIIGSLPPDVGAWEALREIADRVSRPAWAGAYPDLHEATHLPLADVEDLSEHGELKLVVTLSPGADAEAVTASLRTLRVVAVEVLAAFPVPLAQLLRSWADRHRDEDIAASLAELDSAVRQDRQREKKNR
jgi:DNA gyrase/topoisomerase IV subunit A